MSVAQIIAPIIAGLLIEQQFLTTWAMLAALTTAAGFVINRTLVSRRNINVQAA